MAGIKDLQTKVRAVIIPWTSSDQEPPFTPPDLLTMALILNNRTMDESEILDSVERNFRYYRILVANAPRYWHDDEFEHGESRTFKDLEASNEMSVGFNSYVIPAIATSTGEFTLCINEARIYMQQRFGPSPDGDFPFFRLPAELRSVIYDMVFQYPIGGLLVPYGGGVFETMTQSLTEPFSTAAWHGRKWWSHHGYYTQSFSNVLQLLLVNKQIHEEAFPCFFRLNLFYFATCRAAYDFLNGLVPYRRQHISRIAIHYSRRDTEYGPRVFDYLASLPNLQKLYVNIDEDKWNRPFIGKQIDILKIPGLEKLRKVGVEEVIFTGNSPKIAAYLKAEMERRGAKKRKKIEGETTAREQRGEQRSVAGRITRSSCLLCSHAGMSFQWCRAEQVCRSWRGGRFF